MTVAALSFCLPHGFPMQVILPDRNMLYGRKTVTTESGKLEIDVPRDRQSSFDPQLIAKYQGRFPGFDDKIVSMYAGHEHPGDHRAPA
jgi:transposase-like protein